MLILHIARRYLFSRTRLHAVNYVTALSTVAIAVVSMALVCVLSVYNGYVEMILSSAEQIDPELEIRSSAGRAFDLRDYPQLRQQLHAWGAEAVSLQLESKALLQLGAEQWVVSAIGVDSAFYRVHPLGRSTASVPHRSPHIGYDGADSLERTPLQLGAGILLASDSGHLGAESAELLFPKRLGLINPLSPGSAFQSLSAEIVGQYPPMSQETDQSVYLPLSDLRQALDYQSEEVSAVALSLRPGSAPKTLAEALQKQYAGALVALDRQAQHPDLSYLVRMEKVMTYLILLFILLLSAFNIASSLAMLQIEKQEDERIYTALGAPPHFMSKIFRAVGLLISLSGSIIGMVLGLGLSLAQKHWGFIASGDGPTPMPLPIAIRTGDLLFIFAAVTAISYLISLYPTRVMSKARER